MAVLQWIQDLPISVAIAATCAMPWPIVPAPITAMRMICDF